jgi:transposase InsO family protein
MPSVGSTGDSYDNALAETINGLYKTEVIHKRGPWKMKLPLEMGVLSFVQNVDKELRNGGKASTCGIHAGI